MCGIGIYSGVGVIFARGGGVTAAGTSAARGHAVAAATTVSLFP